MHAWLYIVFFFLSGVAGLIYESIWSHYLKLFLGHAAYAQTLVLAIYMGGMAAGSWIAGLTLRRTSKPLEIYAIIEITLGIAALFFHLFFLSYQNHSYETILPFLKSKAPIFIYKWLSASLFILPQSMLLGATFPFMVAGFIRYFPEKSGHDIAILYFANTLGASLGVLLSGFILIGSVGLRGTIMIAGGIDIFVGLGILYWGRFSHHISEAKSVTTEVCRISSLSPIQKNGSDSRHTIASRFWQLLIIANLTAISSFMYELGWIRMLSLVLGSSTHSFEIMLSTFILGIALGSFLIRKKIDMIANIPRALVLVQIFMGICALLSVFMYGKMFHLMKFFMGALSTTAEGYFFFNVFSDLICMLVMLPSTICAGMVLPLIIHFFYASGSGEFHIGKVYAFNTLGGIIGIIVSVWILMPSIGVRFLITCGGIIDIAIGIFILYFFNETKESYLKKFLPVCSVLVILFSVIFGRIDPALAASGVFRNGTIASNIRMISHTDGRTATISLYKSNDNLVLATNGKPDAGINVHGGICGDEYTMALCGVLPISIVSSGARAAVIGLGSGMTAHYLLYDTTLTCVDIIEIEPAMAAAAKKIGTKVNHTFTDKRAHLYIDDAKSFFSTSPKKYDIIISEPSNPWVSGISGLFSVEFFGRIKQNLTDDGILVQWIHRYESDISIITSILGALQQHFPIYRLFAVGSDYIIIASTHGGTNLDFKRDPFSIVPLAKQLREMHFESIHDFSLLRLGSERIGRNLIKLFPAPPNSDYSPYIDLNAVKYRFIDDNIKQFDTLYRYIIPVRKIIEADTSFIPLHIRAQYPDLSNLTEVIDAKKLYHEITFQKGSTDTTSNNIASTALLLDCIARSPDNINFDKLFEILIDLFEKTLPYLSSSEMGELWRVIDAKCSDMEFSPDDSTWMNYFQALCTYNFPVIKELAVDLLPEIGPIDDNYINRMLLTSLILASALLEDSITAYQYYSRFTGRKNPGLIIDLCFNLKHFRK